MKQIKFLHTETMGPTDICQFLLKIYQDQTTDVSAVRCFSSANSDKREATLRMAVQIFMTDMEAFAHQF